MKRFLLISMVFVMALALPVWADDDFESYLDINGSTGFTMGYLTLDLAALNDDIAGHFPELSQGMMVYGSTNFMGFKEGLRWGGTWFIGVNSEKDDADALSQLTVSVGGLDINYGKVLTDQIDVTLGGLMGVGAYELILREGPLVGPEDPNKIYLSNLFFAVGPKVTVDYYLNEWCTLRGIAGYVYGIGNKQWLDVKDRTDAVQPLGLQGAILGGDFSIVY